MFDFAWTQIGLIGVVALVLIGPKDLPVAIKAVAGFVKKARRMAGEFQSHVDDMVKDTELAELRNQISEIRSFDVRREVQRAIDPDGSISATFQDPFKPPASPPSIVTGGTTAEVGSVVITPLQGGVPAFIPPAAAAALPLVAAAAGPPAFIPPAVAAAGPAAGAAPAS